MARTEETMGNFEGKFALTGCILLMQPDNHALLPMASCVFIAKS
jgi:hypothetical protein